MINRFFFLFSAVLLSWGSNTGIASGSFPITHTQYTPELKPAFLDSDNSYKTASVCFLGAVNCGNDGGFNKGDDYTIDTARQCLNEGFIKNNCNSVQEADGICPYNSSYVKGCKCKSGLITCSKGQIGVGDECGGQYASCQCDPALISCPSNKNGSGASCGGRYESCVCKNEYQYTSSNCTSPRSVSGASCDGKYTECICPAGVPVEAYGCKEYYPSPCGTVCKEAYTDNCHKRTDNRHPTYGCMKSWADCDKYCETPYTNNCHNQTAAISSCPANANCYYFSDCTSKIQNWSCKSGFSQNGNSCIVNVSCNLGGYYSSTPMFNTCRTINYQGLTCFTDCKRLVNIYEMWASSMCYMAPRATIQYKGPKDYSYMTFPNGGCQNGYTRKSYTELYIGSTLKISGNKNSMSTSGSSYGICNISRRSVDSYYTGMSCSSNYNSLECTMPIENNGGTSTEYDVYIVWADRSTQFVTVNGKSIPCQWY